MVDPAGMGARTKVITMALALFASGQVYRLSVASAALLVALMFRYVSPAGPITTVVGAAVAAARGRGGVSVTDRWSWQDTTISPVASPRARSAMSARRWTDGVDGLKRPMSGS